jgi:hypothetical protein
MSNKILFVPCPFRIANIPVKPLIIAMSCIRHFTEPR